MIPFSNNNTEKFSSPPTRLRSSELQTRNSDCYLFFRNEQILTLTAQLFNVNSTWQKEKLKSTCTKKGKGHQEHLSAEKKISCSENLNCSTKPALILSDKKLTPMSKVKYTFALTTLQIFSL